MKNALEAIIKQLTGIAYSDLSTAEKNILRIAASGLGLTVTIKGDEIKVQ
jgi:transcription termination factor NusB